MDAKDNQIVQVRNAPIVQAQDPRIVNEQMTAIHACLKGAMKDGEDYGQIPGTSGKKVLLKSGAEKLAVLFGLSVETEVEERALGGDHREYRSTVKLVHRATGSLVGTGVGTCSTMESRYRWRKGERTCPECGTTAIIKGKADFGGGWLCWNRKGGCGAKWPDGADVIEGQNVERIENVDIADLWNTVLKMSKKRALVDAVLTGTAASSMFTQDLEETRSDDDAPRAQPVAKSAPQASNTRPEAQPKPAGERPPLEIKWRDERYTGELSALKPVIGAVKLLSEKPTSNGGMRYGVLIKTEDGEQWVSHFNDTAQGLLSEAKNAGLELRFGCAKNGNFLNLHAFRENNDDAPEQAPPDEAPPSEPEQAAPPEAKPLNEQVPF